MADPTDPTGSDDPTDPRGSAAPSGPDGGFALLSGRSEYVDRIFADLGHQLSELDSLGGGAVRIVGFERDGYMTAATVGLHRVPLDAGEPAELTCDAPAGTPGAAVVTLGIAAERVVQTRRSLEPGKVWINEVPYLQGSTISAMLVPDDDPHRTAVRDASGAVLGHVRRVVMLTNVEARYVAEHGLAALPGDDEALRNPHRADLVGIDRLQVQPVPCIVSKLLREQPARWVEVDHEGRFAALAMTETPEYLESPDNVEVWSLRTLVEKNPGLREFAVTAVPGDCARLTEDGWVAARQDGFVE